MMKDFDRKVFFIHGGTDTETREKIRAITYLPDFLCPNRDWIIECKGFANDRFPIKWKMFKNLLKETNPECKLFVPKNQKQVLETIEIIKNL